MGKQLGRRTAEIALRTVTGFGADRCSISAAGITYFALISIFPLLLVALSVAGFVFSSEADQQRLIDRIVDTIPIDEEGGRNDIEQIVSSVVDARGTLGLFGILSGLYTGSALFTAVRLALNGIFGGEKPRPFVLGKAVDISMVLGFGLLLMVSTASSFVIAYVGRLAEEFAGDGFEGTVQIGMTAAAFAVAIALSLTLFLVLYTRVPAATVHWKYALPGALLAALLFEALKVGFAFYAANFGNYNATYGSLGFVILMLAFINFTAQITLLGAEAARATAEVAKGWPLAPDESKLHSVAERTGKFRRAILTRLGRDVPAQGGAPAPVQPAGSSQPGSLESATGVTPRLRERRKVDPRASWLTAGVLLAGFVGAVLAGARGKR